MRLILFVASIMLMMGHAVAETNYDGTYIYKSKKCFDKMTIKNKNLRIKVSGTGGCFNDTYRDRIKRTTKRGFTSGRLNCRKKGENLNCKWINCKRCKGRDLFIKQ